MAHSSQRTRVERCALCGAPLQDISAYIVTCTYCHEENRLVSKEAEDIQRRAEDVTRAANEAHEMTRRLQQKREKLEGDFGAAMTDFMADKTPAKGAHALHSYNALLWILQAPSVHIAIAMGPPGVVVMRRIDEALRDTLASFAAEHGITHG